ncbi:MAG TPA: hypothetical protein PLD79_02665 [Halothiobacillus sp.]|nr:MAG: hypothetical protein B7Z82_04860 [Halothiobacillus sp. 20-54-6]HQT42870.1 hypothetical protein [Halothiobacillus sp.]
MRRIFLASLAVMACTAPTAHADGLNWNLILGGSSDGGRDYHREPPPAYVIVAPRREYDAPVYVYPDERRNRDDRYWRDRQDERRHDDRRDHHGDGHHDEGGD